MELKQQDARRRTPSNGNPHGSMNTKLKQNNKTMWTHKTIDYHTLVLDNPESQSCTALKLKTSSNSTM